MNEVLKDKLRVLANDTYMMEAIRWIVASQIEKLKPSIDEIVDNRVLGEKFRAVEESYKLLNNVLQDIGSFKDQRSSKQLTNKGK